MNVESKLRRRLLLAGGGAAALLPWLEVFRGGRLAQAQAQGPIKRFMVFFYPGGVIRDKFWPTGGETDFKMPSGMEPISAYRDKLLILDGLQQANMSPIYSYLGADESSLPLLWLAGPMTGLIVQPIIGALSDKTITKWGRRTPYFLIGAILCSLSLLVMPFSSSVWMAASVLWILDASNNVTQEPYRAFVSDKLDKSQHSLGFLTQSAFTGLGQTLSYLTPFLLINFFAISESGKIGRIPTSTLLAFLIGGVVSITSILWTLKTTKEIPLTDEEKARIRASPAGVGSTFGEIFEAMREMPVTMKLMAPMMLFSWYGMFIYWQYIAKCVSQTLYNTIDSESPLFRKAEIWVGPMGAFYNAVAFISAFGLAWLAKKYGP